MNGENIKQVEQEVLRRMIWVNTCLNILLLFVVVNIAAWLFTDTLIYRAAIFLVISLITLFVWDKWRKMIKEVLI